MSEPVSDVAARFHVTGRVQGVFFRAGTQREAQRLGLRGHAINLRDGSVEVVARGDADALAALERWLQHGPELARVEAVTRAVFAGDVAPGFRVG